MGLVQSAGSKSAPGGGAANDAACRRSVRSHLFEHREWPTAGHEQHQPGHRPQGEATDNRVRVGIHIPTSIIGLEFGDDDGGHRSGPWPQRLRVSHIPRHQGELDTTERRIRLLGSAKNDAASGSQFLFLRRCRHLRVWISGEVYWRIALERWG
jgi:hypothetical protein